MENETEIREGSLVELSLKMAQESDKGLSEIMKIKRKENISGRVRSVGLQGVLVNFSNPDYGIGGPKNLSYLIPKSSLEILREHTVDDF